MEKKPKQTPLSRNCPKKSRRKGNAKPPVQQQTWFKNPHVGTKDFNIEDPDQYDKEMRIPLIELFCCALLDVKNQLPNDMYRSADLHRDQNIARKMVRGMGIGFLCSDVPDLIASFMRFLETDVPCYPEKFVLQPGHQYPVFLGGLFRWMHEKEGISCKLETDLVRCIYQIGALLKKFKGPYRDSVVQQFVAGMLETDRELGEYNAKFHSKELEKIILYATHEIEGVLEGLSPYDPFTRDLFIPRPGPGGTANQTLKRNRFSPELIHRSVNMHLPYREWFELTPTDAVENMQYWRDMYCHAADEPYSLFLVVPKTYSKPRGICEEENEVQCLQQAMRRAMYYWLEHHPLTKGRIYFTDQTYHQRLALVGSETQEWVTLDMKDGSQRVAKRLCFHLFSQTEMWPFLNALSTNEIVLNPPYAQTSTTWYSNMFAPMGSAICFPMMSMVHYFLCRAIIAVICPPKYKKYMDRVYVYGDDIICHYDVAAAVCEWLPKFGMKFNLEKSFIHSRFRESCGVHAYNGVDITPVYVRGIPTIHHLPTPSLLSAVAAERGLHDRGFHLSAEWLRTHVDTVLQEELPIVWEDSPEFGWTCSTRISQDVKRFKKRRRNGDLQCLEVRLRVSSSRQKAYRLTGKEALYRYLVMNPRYADTAVKENPRVTFKWVWVAHSAV